MFVKEIIFVLLISGSLQILASDNTVQSPEFQNEQIKHFKINEKKSKDASLQFQKDYYRWEDKKDTKFEYKKFKGNSDYRKLNEIDSHEYVDKYNKYGNTFNPKILYRQKNKAAYHQKRASGEEKHHETNTEPGNLFHDVDVNFINNNKKIAVDSELISENIKPGNLLHDTDVNFINNNREIGADSELISDNIKPGSLLHDTDVNFINNNKEIAADSELISENIKPGSLLHDTDVNFINNNKEIAVDSELISENIKPPNLLHDTDVNFINNNKEISADSELISENIKPPNLLHDTDVNFINNNKKIAVDSELISENIKPGNLLHDTDVNFINNNKEIAADSELISEKATPRNLFLYADVNFNTDDNIDKESGIGGVLSRNSLPKNKENYEENYQNGDEFYMKRFKKNFYQSINPIDLSSPPSPNDTILMARYIVHTIDWAAMATISTRPSNKGFPFACVKATSDGMQNASSGIPFFYMTPLDLCTQDLEKDNRVSILVTLSETDYCKNKAFDPQDPRCARLALTGKIKKIKPGSDIEKFARKAMFSRHPAMESWPADHNWFFAKLKIGQIMLIDKFGGASYIKVKDYLNGKSLGPELKK